MRSIACVAACVTIACSPTAPRIPSPAGTANAMGAAAVAPPKPAASPTDPAFAPASPATLAVGEAFACAIRKDQRVACWGDNSGGQLGQGDVAVREGAVAVLGIERAVEVAAGDTHACARLETGNVWCWGDGTAFRLGSQRERGPHAPVRVPDVVEAVAISVGPKHSCAVIRDGSLRCWGSAKSGRLGLDHLDHVTGPSNVALAATGVTGVAVGEQTTCARDVRGRVSCWGIGEREEAHRRTNVQGVSDIVDLTVGNLRTCAQSRRGRVQCWRHDGKAEALDTPSNLTQVPALGASNGCGITAAGPVCWGSAVVLGTSAEVTVAAPLAYDMLAGATEVRARTDNVCARGAHGDVHCWGDNARGQLGRGRGGVYAEPVSIAFAGEAVALDAAGERSCALGKDCKLRCWGRAAWGKRATKQWHELENVTSFSLSPTHACAVHHHGKVACWGPNGGPAGELGEAAAPPKTAASRKIGARKKAGARNGGILALLDGTDGTLFARPGGFDHDSNFVAQVAGVPSARSVVAGQRASCALSASGAWCWGDDGTQLTKYRTSLSGGPCSPFGGHRALCEASRTARRIPNTKSATMLVAASQGFCALRKNGGVACWQGPTPTPVRGLSAVQSLHRGIDETCAIDGSGSLQCWEPGRQPRRNEDFAEPLIDWAESEDFQCAVTQAGGVLCRGLGSDGQLGDGGQHVGHDNAVRRVVGISNAVAVRLGERHACALLKDGAVKCWGAGDAQMARPQDELPSSFQPIRVVLMDGGTPKSKAR